MAVIFVFKRDLIVNGIFSKQNTVVSAISVCHFDFDFVLTHIKKFFNYFPVLVFLLSSFV